MLHICLCSELNMNYKEFEEKDDISGYENWLLIIINKSESNISTCKILVSGTFSISNIQHTCGMVINIISSDMTLCILWN